MRKVHESSFFGRAKLLLSRRRLIGSAGASPPALGPLPNSENFLIDLNPLLAEIAAGTISDADDFQAADEFLLLRDLLADEDFEELCETLYHFLWREAQSASPENVRTGASGQVWIDPEMGSTLDT